MCVSTTDLWPERLQKGSVNRTGTYCRARETGRGLAQVVDHPAVALGYDLAGDLQVASEPGALAHPTPSLEAILSM